jgi:hypothetical protein
MKEKVYIQEYGIRGGMDERAGETTKIGRHHVDDCPEKTLWDMVLNEISGGYEQRLFVNDDEYDIVGSDEDINDLIEEGMESFKEEHHIGTITSMGYYDDVWSGIMSDRTEYRIEKEVIKPTLEQVKEALFKYLETRFDETKVVDDWHDVLVEGLQARYITKQGLKEDIERIFNGDEV